MNVIWCKKIQGLNTSTSPVLLETTVPPDFGDLQPREEGQISELRCFQFFRSVWKTLIFVVLHFVHFVQAARNWCNGFPKTNEVHFQKLQKTNIQHLRYICKIFISPPRGVPPVASLLDSRLSVNLNEDSPTHPMETREVFEEEQDESEDQWHWARMYNKHLGLIDKNRPIWQKLAETMPVPHPETCNGALCGLFTLWKL